MKPIKILITNLIKPDLARVSKISKVLHTATSIKLYILTYLFQIMQNSTYTWKRTAYTSIKTLQTKLLPSPPANGLL